MQITIQCLRKSMGTCRCIVRSLDEVREVNGVPHIYMLYFCLQ
jgi:hypothetical protein